LYCKTRQGFLVNSVLVPYIVV